MNPDGAAVSTGYAPMESSAACDVSSGSGESSTVAGSGESVLDEVAAAAGLLAGSFQMPSIVDAGRHRRKRSLRKLKNRNSVPEEVMAEQQQQFGE